MKIYQGQNHRFALSLTQAKMTELGYAYADIEEISVNIKRIPSSDEDDKYMESLKTTGDIVLDEANEKIMVHFSQLKTGAVEPNKYTLVLGIKFTGLPKMVELEISDSEYIVTTDKQRA